MTLTSIYSLGIIPGVQMMKKAREVISENKEIIYEEEEVLDIKVVEREEEAFRLVPPSFEEMLPLARK